MTKVLTILSILFSVSVVSCWFDPTTLPLSKDEKLMVLALQDTCKCKIVYQHVALIRDQPEEVDTSLDIGFWITYDTAQKIMERRYLRDSSAIIEFSRSVVSRIIKTSPYIDLYRKVSVHYSFHQATATQNGIKSHFVLFRIDSNKTPRVVNYKIAETEDQ